MDDDGMTFNLNGKRIWIAGHNGMVGAALIRRLQSETCEILTVSKEELDLCDQAATRLWVTNNKPDVIVIAAAKVGGIGANAAFPAQFFYDNIMIQTNIMHAAYETGVEKLLFLGSSCIYPRDCLQPIKEEYLLSGPLEPTNEAYAIAKIAGLKMAQFYRRQYGCNFISAMPCNLYGVGDTYDENHSHVIPALIMKTHAAKIKGDSQISVWGSGRALREFLDVDDLADALVFLLKHYEKEVPINIGSSQEISIYNLAKIISETIGFKGNIDFDPKKPDGTPKKVMDNTHLTAMGWSAKLCLKDGLKKAYLEYLGRYGYENSANSDASHSGGRFKYAV